MFGKILCATDLSTDSRNLVTTAARFAKDEQCELVIANVTWASGLEAAQRDLAQACWEASKLGAPEVSTRLAIGGAWQEIVEMLVVDPAFDLVVVGTHGRTGIARAFGGSVAESVVRHAPCSVMIVREDVVPELITHVLCPVDLTPLSRDAAAIAAQACRGVNASLTLLHVLEEDPPTREDEARIEAELEGWRAALHERAGGARVKCRTRIGRADAEIGVVLAEDRYDLVVMGTHGRTGLRRLRQGSVAESVMRRATCPVLVARPHRQHATRPVPAFASQL